VGNIVTKYCEGLGKTIADWLGEELKNDLAGERIKTIQRDLLSRTIKADEGGGGPLWAVNGLVFKGHGRSRAYEMAQTVKSARMFAELDIVGALKAELLIVRSRMKKDEG
jgi:fatty acid/phospholipid biosynthesis enzyme